PSPRYGWNCLRPNICSRSGAGRFFDRLFRFGNDTKGRIRIALCVSVKTFSQGTVVVDNQPVDRTCAQKGVAVLSVISGYQRRRAAWPPGDRSGPTPRSREVLVGNCRYFMYQPGYGSDAPQKYWTKNAVQKPRRINCFGGR